MNEDTAEKRGRIPLDELAEKKEEEATFETLLDSLGHFGKHQRIIFSLMTLSDIMNSLVLMFFVFSTVVPRWRCLQFEGLNVTGITVVNEGLNPTASTVGNPTASTVGNPTVVSTVGNATNDTNVWSFESVCEFNGSKCIRFDFDSDGYRGIVVEWDLVCDRKYIPSLTTSITMFGMLIGAGLAAQTVDLIGRRKVLLVVNSLMLLCQTLVGVSVNWQMFAAMRFFTGAFVAASIALSFLLPMEFIGPKWRSFVGGLGVYDLGGALSALVAYLTKDWRHQALISGTVFIPLLIAIMILVPESIRWLIQKQRFPDAAVGIKKMARVNRKPVPDLTIMERISRAQNYRKVKESRYTYIDLFRTRKLAVKTLVLVFNWFTASVIYYGLATSVSSLSGNLYLNAVYASLPGLFLGWTVIPMANWLGRKGALALYGSIPIVSMFGIVILQATGQIEEQATAKTALALIGQLGIGEMWSMVTIITSEQYPTVMRSIGMGTGSASARIAGVLAPQVWILRDIAHWTVPYVINGSLTVGSVILVLVLLPETRGRPMPEEVPPPCQCRRRPAQKESNRYGEAPSLLGGGDSAEPVERELG